MTPVSGRLQLVTFVAVGLAATATHTAFALLAHRILNLPPLVANLVGYASAILVSYGGNAVLTFRRPLLLPVQFARFLAVSLVAFALNEALVFVCTGPLGMPFYAALVPVVLVVPLFTFTVARVWAFIERPVAARPNLGSEGPG